MKYRVQAIDSKGRVVRVVLRAESEDEAREMLLAEELFAKRLDEAPDGEAVTWVSKTWVKDRLERARSGAAAAGESPRIPSAAATAPTTMADGHRAVRGRFAAHDGRIYFEPEGRPQDTRVWQPESIETTRIAGFPARRLCVFLIDGSMVEFAAGFAFAGAAFKAAARK